VPSDGIWPRSTVTVDGGPRDTGRKRMSTRFLVLIQRSTAARIESTVTPR
jgi:hypothetical protein